jgi:orotate phosphoribosyltransferase
LPDAGAPARYITIGTDAETSHPTIAERELLHAARRAEVPKSSRSSKVGSRNTAALLGLASARRGHFRLESGYHSALWLELDALFAQPREIAPYVAALSERIRAHGASVVCGPLLGGAFLAQLVAHSLDIEFCFTERVPSTDTNELYAARYVLPRAFHARVRGQRVAIVDDVMSAGSALRGTFSELSAHGATTIVAGALLVLGSRGVDFFAERKVAVEAVCRDEFEMWAPDECPHCAVGAPLDDAADTSGLGSAIGIASHSDSEPRAMEADRVAQPVTPIGIDIVPAEKQLQDGPSNDTLDHADKRGRLVHAAGPFEVKLDPQATAQPTETSLGRMSIDKRFHGDLEGTSKGEMLTAGTGVTGSGGYVAIERVTGALGGRIGSFTLQHSGTMTRGTPQLTITVVPDSGTEQLEGLTGSMKIDIAAGKHSYAFDYTLPGPSF